MAMRNQHIADKALAMGFESLSEAELVAFLTNSDTGEVQGLLNEIGGLHGLCGLDMEDQRVIDVMGNAAQWRVAVAFEIARREVAILQYG